MARVITLEPALVHHFSKPDFLPTITDFFAARLAEAALFLSHDVALLIVREGAARSLRRPWHTKLFAKARCSPQWRSWVAPARSGFSLVEEAVFAVDRHGEIVQALVRSLNDELAKVN